MPRRRLDLVDVLTEFAEDTQVAPLLREYLVTAAYIGVVEFVNSIARTECDLFGLRIEWILHFRSPAEASISAQPHL